MKAAELLQRLEVVVLRLERVVDRLPPSGSDPVARSAGGDGEGEGELSPQASIEADKMAEKLIEAQMWEAEKLVRAWEQKGGPSDDDAEAYLSSWATKP